MPTNRLTDREVKAAPKRAKRYELSDGGQGLYLAVFPSGKKSWVFRYRHRRDPKKLTIGPYPAFSLADARRLEDEYVKAVHLGRDPAAEKRTEKNRAPDLVKNLGADFIEKYVRQPKRGGKPELRTADEIERLFELHVYPTIGKRDAREVTKSDILDLLDKVGGVRANRVFACVRKLFNWAVDRDIIQVSPCKSIKMPAEETARSRKLAEEELRAFLKACDKLGKPFDDIFRLLLLTGQRRDEVASAPWSEFEFGEKPMWRLPGERTKNARPHDVPLAPQAVAIIAGLPTKGKRDLLFPSRKGTDRSASGFGRAKRRLDALMLAELQKAAEARGDDPAKVKLPEWRLHDLRRTAASGWARLGVGIHICERLLNHVSGTTTGGIIDVYQEYDFAAEKRAAAIVWANDLDGLLIEKPSNVISLAKDGAR